MSFAGAILLGVTDEGLALETRGRHPIPNLIIPEPDEGQRGKAELFVTMYRGFSWQERKGITGTYNCAGHVWASRRTAILDQNVYELILKDDGYRRLLPSEEKRVGDLVTYWDSDANGKTTFLHVGMVCEMRGLNNESKTIPWVLSKWGTISGEWRHHVDDVPFEKMDFRLLLEFYTDRP